MQHTILAQGSCAVSATNQREDAKMMQSTSMMSARFVKIAMKRTAAMPTKNNTPSEHSEQVAFVTWFRKTFPGVLIFAIPNGGYRARKTAADLKAEGLTKGIPDLEVPEWDLWIEMKRQKGGRQSTEQKEVAEYLNEIGDTYILARGAEDAQQQLIDFLNGHKYYLYNVEIIA